MVTQKCLFYQIKDNIILYLDGVIITQIILWY